MRSPAQTIVRDNGNQHNGSRSLGRANFLASPRFFAGHTAREAFGGATMWQTKAGEWMLASWWRQGDAPLLAVPLAPRLWRSRDNGRSWQESGRMPIAWQGDGAPGEGGLSALRLQDGRLAFLAHRSASGFFGGGVPVLSFSSDDGETWSPARVLQGEHGALAEGAYYVMNDRLLQLQSGRLLLMACVMEQAAGRVEGDANALVCFSSDDGGATWRVSKPVGLENDARGLQEPCALECNDGSLWALARTGRGCHYALHSYDGGQSWSAPEPTPLQAACSPFQLRRLPDGRFLALYNAATPLYDGAFFPRTPLCYALSSDEGASWSAPFVVDDEAGRQLIYPSIRVVEEGVLLVYSSLFAPENGGFDFSPSEQLLGGGKSCLLAISPFQNALPSVP